MIYRPMRIRSLHDALVGGIAVAVIGFLAYQFFAAGLYQPSVIQRGFVAISGGNRGEKVSAQTRLIQVGRRTFWQVEYPPVNGRIVDRIAPQCCAGLFFAIRDYLPGCL